ncbi:MAG: cytidine deaminase [Deltaproteobacteria bacterium]|nr:cytidine deaminase [Deltaproteobacteria bacterium]
MITAAQKSRLLQAAREVLEKAYAPYSRFRVGAALLTAQGNLFSGANVENASYGLALCAERAAIAAAVAAEGADLKITALAVVSNAPGAFPPCGACRQVIQEFGEGAAIIFYGQEGLVQRPLEELLPVGFHLVPKRNYG